MVFLQDEKRSRAGNLFYLHLSSIPPPIRGDREKCDKNYDVTKSNRNLIKAAYVNNYPEYQSDKPCTFVASNHITNAENDFSSNLTWH